MFHRAAVGIIQNSISETSNKVTGICRSFLNFSFFVLS